MSESDKGKSKDAGGPEGDSDYKKPRGASAELESSAAGEKRRIEARADWIVLRKDDEPSAEMFFVSYLEKTGEQRPLTFVFNGGPGASSVYLHMKVFTCNGETVLRRAHVLHLGEEPGGVPCRYAGVL